ncbi:MAG TPA: hypothetical protein VGC89_04790 [Pyrinomonadaceae bacterium]
MKVETLAQETLKLIVPHTSATWQSYRRVEPSHSGSTDDASRRFIVLMKKHGARLPE